LLTAPSVRVALAVLIVDSVAHRPIAALPFVPHAQQCRVPGIHKIDNPDVGLARLFSMQSSGVLLQRSLPRNGHRQYQRVQRRVIKALAHELACRQEYTRCLRW
jgi:uncharacterized protein YifN (PemK superfamily)